MRFWKCDFCEKKASEIAIFAKKCDFENVNFAKNTILKMWISWITWFKTCELWLKCEFLPQCATLSWIFDFLKIF